MKHKKNPNVNLEKKKSIFFQIGLIISLAAILVAFNVSTSKSNVENLSRDEYIDIDNEIIPIIRPDEPQEIKPPPPPQQVVEILTVVDDDTDIEEEFEMKDTDVDQDTKIIFYDIEDETEPDSPIIFSTVETMPVFPGGDLGLRKYIVNHTKYPNIAREGGVEGKIYVRFCVNEKGAVEKVSILRGVDPLLDKEALRVVKMLPSWEPGEQGGEKVSVWYTVPINFKLQ